MLNISSSAKLVIPSMSGFRKTTDTSDAENKEHLRVLSEALQRIQSGTACSAAATATDLLSRCYQLTIRKQGPTLLDAVLALIKKECERQRDRVLAVTGESDGVITAFVDSYMSQAIQWSCFQMLLLHLQCDVPANGMETFQQLMTAPSLLERLLAAMCNVVDRERGGELVPIRDAHRTFASIFQSFRLGNPFVTIIVPRLLSHSAEYFHQTALRYSHALPVDEYCSMYLATVAEDTVRLNRLFPGASFLEDMRHMLHKVMLGPLLALYTQRETGGTKGLLEDQRYEALAIVYICFAQSDSGLAVLASHFGHYVTSVLKDFLFDKELNEAAPMVLIERVLGVRKMCVALTLMCLESGEVLSLNPNFKSKRQDPHRERCDERVG